MESTQCKTTFPARDSERATFHPPTFFANKDRVARWSLMAVLVLGTSQCVSLLLVCYLATRPPWIASRDPAGNWWAELGQSLDEAKAVQVEQAFLATCALLQRSRNEFDLPEVLQSLFSRPALDAAMALKAVEAQEFQDKAISQKVHPGVIEALNTRPDMVRVAVTGKLERHCVLRQQAFSEVVGFTLRLTFRLNPDRLDRTHPLIVADFQVDYETPR